MKILPSAPAAGAGAAPAAGAGAAAYASLLTRPWLLAQDGGAVIAQGMPAFPVAAAAGAAPETLAALVARMAAVDQLSPAARSYREGLPNRSRLNGLVQGLLQANLGGDLYLVQQKVAALSEHSPKGEMLAMDFRPLLAVMLSLCGRQELPAINLLIKVCSSLQSIVGSNAESQKSLMAYGGFAVAMAVLHSYPRHPALIIELCKLMRTGTWRNTECKKKLVEMRVMGVLRLAMREYPDNAALQEAALWVLCNLSTLPEGQLQLREMGLLDTVAKAMQQHKQSGEVVRAAAWVAVNGMTEEQEQNTFRSNGGLRLTVEALERHGGSKDVAEALCRALRSLTWRNSASKADFGAAEGPRLVMQTLEHMQRDTLVVEQVFWAVANTAGLASNKADYLARLAPQEMAKALERHGGTGTVVTAICWAITNTLGGAADLKAFREAGGVAALVEAMRKNAGQVAVMEPLCRAIRTVTCRAPENKEAFHAKGGIPLLVAVLENHIDSASCIENACGAVANVCASVTNQAAFRTAGGITRVIRCLKRYGGQKSVASIACWAVTNTCSQPEGQLQFHAQEGVEALAEVIQLHGTGEPEFAEPALRAIRAVCLKCRPNQSALLLHGGIAGLAAMASKQWNSPMVQEQLNQALDAVLPHEDCRDALQAAGVPQAGGLGVPAGGPAAGAAAAGGASVSFDADSEDPIN